MSLLVEDCPRCGAERMTFDVQQELFVYTRYDWQRYYEMFCVCRGCHKSTTFLVSQKNIQDGEVLSKRGALLKVEAALNAYVTVERYISIRDEATQAPPDHVPSNIKAAFQEAATCLTVECWNASGAMFRMCIDLATRPMLPTGEAPGLNAKIRRDLGLRLRWLFENGTLAPSLRELSASVREDGNDGAHAGTLKKEDAEDLLDFTSALLERLYTEPERLRLAEERRKARREEKQ